MSDYRQNAVAYKRPEDEALKKARQAKIILGTDVEQMLNTRGGTWLKKRLTDMMNIQEVLSKQGPDERLKALNKAEVAYELWMEMQEKILFKQKLEGEKHE